jgi:hypothetical protein
MSLSKELKEHIIYKEREYMIERQRTPVTKKSDIVRLKYEATATALLSGITMLAEEVDRLQRALDIKHAVGKGRIDDLF